MAQVSIICHADTGRVVTGTFVYIARGQVFWAHSSHIESLRSNVWCHQAMSWCSGAFCLLFGVVSTSAVTCTCVRGLMRQPGLFRERCAEVWCALSLLLQVAAAWLGGLGVCSRVRTYCTCVVCCICEESSIHRHNCCSGILLGQPHSAGFVNAFIHMLLLPCMCCSSSRCRCLAQ